MAAKRDYLQEAKENYQDAADYVREQYLRIREDFEFSNPSAPKQWSDAALSSRMGRPTHTLDRTNKYVQHVVNRLREAKTSAEILPVDSGADPAVAQKIKGMFRHIEYVSRADIAWDTATDHQARGGLGWVRVLTKVVNPESNEQEIMFQRVNDPLSCFLEAGWAEPDGTDAMCGFVETQLTDKQFKNQYPKFKKPTDWQSENQTMGWYGENSVRICEYFKVKEEKLPKVEITGPEGGVLILTAPEYTEMSGKIGYEPKILRDFEAKKRIVHWSTMTGSEIIEETIFPSQYIGLIPVIGHEIWVNGQRYLCGLVRRLMDGQKLHNMEMSALTEALMIQPKAPFLVSGRALEGYEDEWDKLNRGSPSHLPYNDLDTESGLPIAAPIRLSPPNFPVSYSNMANIAVQEMEESVGMPRSTFGQQSNAVSGRAKLADQEAGATATFHFADNRRIAQTQAYRVVLDAFPTVYDSRRQARILGEDGQQSNIEINPELKEAAQFKNGKVVAINPGVGRYDIRVKVGPSYTTIREELGTRLQELAKGNPVLAATLTPMMMKLSDMPEADKITKVVMAMLPPEVRKAYEDDDVTVPPQVKAQLEEQGQQIQKMSAAMDQAGKVIEDLQGQVNEKNTTIQATVKAGIAEIDSAKTELQAQAKEVEHKKNLLNQQVKIAQLELQLAALKNQTALEDEIKTVRDEFETAMKDKEAESEEEKEPEEDKTTKLLVSSQEMIAKAMENSTKAITQLQTLTVDALEDMADAISAPREVQIQKGKNGEVKARSTTVRGE